MNLGNNPRVLGVDEENDGGFGMPRVRTERSFLPSHSMALRVAVKCIPLRGRELMEHRFQEAMTKGRARAGDDGCLCATPVRWFKEGFGPQYRVCQLNSMDEMFPSPGIRDDLSEFFLMDVILNRRIVTPRNDDDVAEPDPDSVVMVRAYGDGDLVDDADFKYRTLVAFLPGAGIFYCARERRRSEVGCNNAHIQLDASWFRFQEDALVAPYNGRFSFGVGGYVKRLAQERNYHVPDGRVSIWRVSTSIVPKLQRRLVYLASQCSDSEGPRMAPDVIAGHNIAAWPNADRGQAFNERLASALSARPGGRHYAKGCLHQQIPGDCLVIDGISAPHVDIIVDIAPIGTYMNRKSVVMVRNLLSPELEQMYWGDEGCPYFVGELPLITMHNSLIRRHVRTGHARSDQGDVGAMHPIGTRVMLDGMTLAEYAVGKKVSSQLSRQFVHALARIGSVVFPDVLSVIQDTEGDAGVRPAAVMAGDVKGNRVGGSIDMSVDLANASHFDSNDASQGFSVWTEEMPGVADNWYFVMPNLHGVSVDGRAFEGVAIKLRHGTAISWDGRLIRHCTSLSRPDGVGTNVVGSGKGSLNHLYGTFTCAKERLVNAGRRRAKMMQEMEEFAYTDEERSRILGDEKEPSDEDEIFAPTIKDADPDDGPVPKDGCPTTWLGWYLGRAMLEKRDDACERTSNVNVKKSSLDGEIATRKKQKTGF